MTPTDRLAESARRGALGRLLPIVIATCLAVDIAARSLPLDPLCFQAWECMTRFQEPGAIFEANRQFRSARTHGNMANMGNLRGERVYRPQVFSTDRYGFRNPGNADEGETAALVVGDSFVAGYGISDDETLPAQLSAGIHRRFYNAGGSYAYLATVRSLKAKLGFQGPVVIVWTESKPIALLEAAEAEVTQPNWQARLLTSVFGQAGGRARELLRGWWFTSPVKVVSEKAFLAISNDRILPNIYAPRVVQRRLQNGEMALFLPTDVAAFHQHRNVDAASAYLQWLTREMTNEGMQPLVVLVPHKYSVYYPLLEAPQQDPGDVVHPLAHLETTLRAAGIAALDLTSLFQERARQDLAKGEYLYWRDDTHWNGRGVAVAAAAIRQAWFASR